MGVTTKDNVVSKVVAFVSARSVMSMTNTQRTAYSRLVSAWKRLDDLRRESVPIRDLATSRRILDEARVNMWRVRGN